MDVQFLMGHSGTAMGRRYAPTRNAEKAARAYARWSPDRFKLSAGCARGWGTYRAEYRLRAVVDIT